MPIYDDGPRVFRVFPLSTQVLCKISELQRGFSELHPRQSDLIAGTVHSTGWARMSG